MPHPQEELRSEWFKALESNDLIERGVVNEKKAFDFMVSKLAEREQAVREKIGAMRLNVDKAHQRLHGKIRSNMSIGEIYEHNHTIDDVLSALKQ